MTTCADYFYFFILWMNLFFHFYKLLNIGKTPKNQNPVITTINRLGFQGVYFWVQKELNALIVTIPSVDFCPFPIYKGVTLIVDQYLKIEGDNYGTT